MIQFVVGAAAGYVLHSKASQAALQATRKAIANKLDPQPRMKEVKNLNRGDGSTVLEPDED